MELPPPSPITPAVTCAVSSDSSLANESISNPRLTAYIASCLEARQLPQRTVDDYITELRRTLAARTDIVIDEHTTVTYTQPDGGTRTYPLISVASKDISEDDKILLIRAGIHGNEISGSLTLRDHLANIFEYAHSRGIKLVVYPLDNPSGYEWNTRYNIEGQTGSGGNNDFIRYRLADGRLVGDVGSGRDPQSGEPADIAAMPWSSDESLHLKLPLETLERHKSLRALPLAQIAGVIDLHEDNYLSKPRTYHFGFGDSSRYRDIISRIEKSVPLLKECNVEENDARPADNETEFFYFCDDPSKPFVLHTDSLGFIQHHDGALPDLFNRLGTPHTITVESGGGLTKEQSDELHRAWIEGLIDLIATEE